MITESSILKFNAEILKLKNSIDISRTRFIIKVSELIVDATIDGKYHIWTFVRSDEFDKYNIMDDLNAFKAKGFKVGMIKYMDEFEHIQVLIAWGKGKELY